MKKIILLLVVLAMLVPVSALAASEFSLGGYIKLDSFWDSTQEGLYMTGPVPRDNDPSGQHGRLHFTAEGSRFNFTIKGPSLWGAVTTGFIEMDFESAQDMGLASSAAAMGNPPGGGINTFGTVPTSGNTSSNNYVPRLRHAMFRLNWPETELMFGQYWSMLCEYYPDVLQDGPFMGTGCPTARLPQIRLTQKFLNDWTVAGLIGDANPVGVQENSYTLQNAGYNAESPQVQGKLMYEKDLWGKAAFFGRPRGFTAQITGAWQRVSLRPGSGYEGDLGETLNATKTGYALLPGTQKNHENLNAWIGMASMFVPVIPTYSANLAGTAALSAQWYVGRGTSAFGFVGDNGLFKYIGTGPEGVNYYDQELLQKFGGYVQGQYWFTNQWYMNVAWGMSRIFHLPDQGNLPGGVLNGARLLTGDQYKINNEIDATIYFRPIEAIKFGLQYSYGRTDYLYSTMNPASSGRYTNVGEAHRIEFCAYYYF